MGAFAKSCCRQHLRVASRSGTPEWWGGGPPGRRPTLTRPSVARMTTTVRLAWCRSPPLRISPNLACTVPLAPVPERRHRAAPLTPFFGISYAACVYFTIVCPRMHCRRHGPRSGDALLPAGAVKQPTLYELMMTDVASLNAAYQSSGHQADEQTGAHASHWRCRLAYNIVCLALRSHQTAALHAAAHGNIAAI